MRKEDKWTRELLCPSLTESLPEKYVVECGKTLLYDVSVKSYKKVNGKYEANLFSNNSRGHGGYETDLLISEKIGENEFVPLVVCESKLEMITTHDLITYNNKAGEHKKLHKGLRYGVVIAECKQGGVTLQKIFNHGCENFDFIFCFKGLVPTEQEWQEFSGIINHQIDEAEHVHLMLTSQKKTTFNSFERDTRTK